MLPSFVCTNLFASDKEPLPPIRQAPDWRRHTYLVNLVIMCLAASLLFAGASCVQLDEAKSTQGQIESYYYLTEDATAATAEGYTGKATSGKQLIGAEQQSKSSRLFGFDASEHTQSEKRRPNESGNSVGWANLVATTNKLSRDYNKTASCGKLFCFEGGAALTRKRRGLRSRPKFGRKILRKITPTNVLISAHVGNWAYNQYRNWTNTTSTAANSTSFFNGTTTSLNSSNETRANLATLTNQTLIGAAPTSNSSSQLPGEPNFAVNSSDTTKIIAESGGGNPKDLRGGEQSEQVTALLKQEINKAPKIGAP